MSSREAILSRLRNALADRPDAPLPPVPKVWPCTNPDVKTMTDRFVAELSAVQGECVRCQSIDMAREKLQAMLEELGATTLAAADRPAVEELVGPLGEMVQWPSDDWTPESMGQLPVSVVSAEYLLADTGTSMVTCETAQQRLLCYIPPVCVVLAKADQLREHLPAAWQEIRTRAAEPDLRGEFVFITGPSRTADIEKILILGVHGPKRLIVLLVE